jgi:hypothetical protein
MVVVLVFRRFGRGRSWWRGWSGAVGEWRSWWALTMVGCTTPGLRLTRGRCRQSMEHAVSRGVRQWWVGG